ncbi:MAG: PKD domain-containing protein, partial [Bacteroidota bacterium]|nr:PKD domain-containing protein [Bacteroidota bacterium]
GDGDIHTNNSSYNVTHTYSTPAPNGQFEIVLNMFSPNCEASVSQNIDLILPVASFEVPLKACVGDELEFNNLSEIANEYYWVFGDSSSSTDENPVHTYSQSGTYNVILSATYNPLGCSDAASKIITIYDPGLNLILPTDSFCLDQPVNFIVSSLFDIAGWELQYGDDDSYLAYTGANLWHTYPFGFSPSDNSISINLTMWPPDSACVREISEEIYLHNVHAKFGSTDEEDFIMCHGNYITFQDQSINSDFNHWDFGDGSSQSNITEPQHYYYSPGQYNVNLHITDSESGCSDKTSETLEVRDDAVIQFPVFYSCEGDPVQLSVSVEGGANNYNWSPAYLLDVPTSSDPVATITESTGFQLSLTDGYGCSGTATVWVEYIVAPPEIYWDTTIIIGDTVHLHTNFNPDYNLLWSHDGSLNCDNCPNPVAFTLETNTYYVTVSDPGDCFSKESEYTINVRQEATLSMPTVFTPNGDGVNDIFIVEGWGIKKISEFKIFNRWGDLVFETTDITEGWNGNYKGKKQATDTYTYIVKVEMYVGNRILAKQGYINLIR